MFNGNYVLTGEIECLTGLHIGGSNNSIEIGGSDNVVIRDAIENLPYIPGSSLKGKLRNLLELNDEETYENVKQKNGEPSNVGLISEVFGKASNKSNYNINKIELDVSDKIKELEERIKQLEAGSVVQDNNLTESNKVISSDKLVKLIVRDSYPTKDTISMWEEKIDIIDGSELKYENTIDRVKCTANPRNLERVPKQSKFTFEIIFGIYNDDEDQSLAKEVYQLLNKGLKLLEDNYLGGSGSRGSGRVKINNLNLVLRDSDYYENNGEEKIVTWG